MKKWLFFLLVVLLFPALIYAKNKMSMVTYFPVPYVAYSQVNVDQQLDIGLTSTCEMNLGCNESEVNLKANRVNLNRGKLELNGGKGVSGQTVTLGTGSGAGQISFTNVRIQGGEMESLNAGSMKVKKLKLFDKEFPPCKGKGKDGNAEGRMQWQKLTLSGASGEELYLVCGGTDQPKDCCSIADDSEFAKCIAEQYGTSSTEYLCANNGNPNPYYDQIGCAKGGLICSIALNVGSVEENIRKDYINGDVWFDSGFRRYACNGKPTYSSGGSGGPDQCTLVSRSKSGSYESCMSACGGHGWMKCSDLGYKAGDTLNASSTGDNKCCVSASCNSSKESSWTVLACE